MKRQVYGYFIKAVEPNEYIAAHRIEEWRNSKRGVEVKMYREQVWRAIEMPSSLPSLLGPDTIMTREFLDKAHITTIKIDDLRKAIVDFDKTIERISGANAKGMDNVIAFTSPLISEGMHTLLRGVSLAGEDNVVYDCNDIKFVDLGR